MVASKVIQLPVGRGHKTPRGGPLATAPTWVDGYMRIEVTQDGKVIICRPGEAEGEGGEWAQKIRLLAYLFAMAGIPHEVRTHTDHPTRLEIPDTIVVDVSSLRGST